MSAKYNETYLWQTYLDRLKKLLLNYPLLLRHMRKDVVIEIMSKTSVRGPRVLAERAI